MNGRFDGQLAEVSTIRVSGWVKAGVEKYRGVFIPFAYAIGTDFIGHAMAVTDSANDKLEVMRWKP